MQKEGVWNFSFELLEECSRDLLNEKDSPFDRGKETFEKLYKTRIRVR